MKLGIVPYGADRHEVQGDDQRIAVFDELADAKRFIAANALVETLTLIKRIAGGELNQEELERYLKPFSGKRDKIITTLTMLLAIHSFAQDALREYEAAGGEEE